MQTLYGKVEIIRFGQEDPDNSEWLVNQLAVDGKLAPAFSVHKADWQEYQDENSLIQMLTRQSIGLLDEFGDARHARIEL